MLKKRMHARSLDDLTMSDSPSVSCAMARDEKPSAQPLVDERAELGIEASAAPHSLEQALHLLLLRRLLQDHASAADANRGGWCVEKAGRERLEEPRLPAM